MPLKSLRPGAETRCTAEGCEDSDKLRIPQHQDYSSPSLLDIESASARKLRTGRVHLFPAITKGPRTTQSSSPEGRGRWCTQDCPPRRILQIKGRPEKHAKLFVLQRFDCRVSGIDDERSEILINSGPLVSITCNVQGALEYAIAPAKAEID